jgi:hypothetical protein
MEPMLKLSQEHGMTEQEKKLHRGQLLVEIEDTEGELAILRDKAFTDVQSLREIANKFERNAELEPSAADFTAEASVENRLTPDERDKFVTVESVAKQIEELKEARQKVFNLRQRRLKLGSVPSFARD